MIDSTHKYEFCNHYHELTEDQTIVDLGTGKFVADKEMLPLLRALNCCGLITRSHCYGHGTGHSWVAIKTENIKDIQIRMDGELKEILITWERKN